MPTGQTPWLGATAHVAYTLITVLLATMAGSPSWALAAELAPAEQTPGSHADTTALPVHDSFALGSTFTPATASESTSEAQAQTQTSHSQPPLEGSVTVSVPYSFKSHLSNLLDTAEQQNGDVEKYQAAIEKYDSAASKVAARAVDTLNYTLMFRGITPSSEAGDVVLGEKDKLKSLASAKYLKQKAQDELHLEVLSGVMQMAMLMGNTNESSTSNEFQTAKSRMAKLVGEKEAERTVTFLCDLRDHCNPQTCQTGQPLWSVAEVQKRMETAAKSAALSDAVVKDIEDDVHHYNQHSTAVLASQRLVRVALSAISLAPNVIGPAAQAALFSFLLVTGGPEQDKVLKELYLDKRLSSRAHLLSEEAHLAVENYQLGALTNNKLLMTCSEQLLARLTDQNTAAKLLSTQSADSQAAAQ